MRSNKLKVYIEEVNLVHTNDTAPPERFKNHGVESEIIKGTKEDSYRSVQKIKNGIDTLLISGKIDMAEASSASRWCNDYEFGELGAKWSAERTGSSSDAMTKAESMHYSIVSRLDARKNYVEASKAVGEFGETILRLFIHEGQSMSSVSRRMGQKQQDMAGAVITVLKRLTEHYFDLDNSRRPKNVQAIKKPQP